MSDPTQTCPPAWELITTPRRSCARPSSAGYNSCNYSVMFPTQGIQYSQVCGRIIGYQVGQPQAFILGENRTIDGRYVDGVSLTYGSPRQHIWTFANALDEAGASNDASRCTCTDSSRPNHLLAMTTSVRLVCHQVNVGAVVPFMLMIPCGMVKVVVQLAHAVHSTIHHGFVNNYLSQLMLIWKSDFAHLILYFLKILR